MIKILNKKSVIERYLNKLGRRVTLTLNGTQVTVFAVIEQTWKRNKSRFEKNGSAIGRYYRGYYIYYGPASCDITKMKEDDRVLIDGELYFFVQSECVKVGDTVQYYRGVLRKEQGGEGYES